MVEYRALHACVLRLWRERDPDGFAKRAEELTTFTEATGAQSRLHAQGARYGDDRNVHKTPLDTDAETTRK
jgi:hypothetical protein